ncbi:2OG-Fe(II) oxygenase [Umbelopsis sp. PMI_123]|nr:2OG-Fe(II) oxygenase [Umbelopsis sp. PMI_123]
MSTAFESLPIIDLAPLQDPQVKPEALKELAATIRNTFETVGFAYLVNHNVNLNHKELFDNTREFFALPQEEKLRLAKKTFVPTNTNTYRGYFPVQKNDTSYKEGFEVGPSVSGDALVQSQGKFNLQEENVWPNNQSEFRRKTEVYYEGCTKLGNQLMRLVAISFGLSEDYFEPLFDPTASTLRYLHYPARDVKVEESAANDDDDALLSCSKHTDSGIVTLLCQDTVGGLEVRNSLGQWIPAPYVPESFVVNLGDLMTRWSNGTFVATLHRVRATNKDRLSIPFFFEPRLDCVIKPLQPCLDNGVSYYSPVVYGEHVLGKMATWVEYQDDRETETDHTQITAQPISVA